MILVRSYPSNIQVSQSPLSLIKFHQIKEDNLNDVELFSLDKS